MKENLIHPSTRPYFRAYLKQGSSCGCSSESAGNKNDELCVRLPISPLLQKPISWSRLDANRDAQDHLLSLGYIMWSLSPDAAEYLVNPTSEEAAKASRVSWSRLQKRVIYFPVARLLQVSSKCAFCLSATKHQRLNAAVHCTATPLAQTDLLRGAWEAAATAGKVLAVWLGSLWLHKVALLQAPERFNQAGRSVHGMYFPKYA